MPDLIYNEYFFTEFYKETAGGDYTDKSLWMPFFENIADNIINTFNPQTVMDAGCAFGYLVEALRNRGVEAYGVDISEYAISKADNSIKSYCFVHSLIKPLAEIKSLPQKFDLIVNIEVMEHLHADEAEIAIANLSQITDTILFSSSPDDKENVTHVNVQQQEQWVRTFAKYQLFRELSEHFDYICPWTILLRKNENLPQKIYDYEVQIRLLNEQIKQMDLRMHEIENAAETFQLNKTNLDLLLKQKRQFDATINTMNTQIAGLEIDNQTLQSEKNNLVNERNELISSFEWRITKPIRFAIRFLRWLLWQNILMRRLQKIYRVIRNEGFNVAMRKIIHKIIRRTKKNEESISINPTLKSNNLLESFNKPRTDKRIQPIPSFHVMSDMMRLNYISDSNMDNTLPEKVLAAVSFASALAKELNCPLRLISRTNDIDPFMFSSITKTNQIDLPANTSYYSDYDRDANGSKPFKLELSDRDIFLVDSLFGVAGARWTSSLPSIYFYVHKAEELLKPNELQSDLYNKILIDQDVHFIVPTRLLLDDLSQNTPAVTDRCYCIEPPNQNRDEQESSRSDQNSVNELFCLIKEETFRV